MLGKGGEAGEGWQGMKWVGCLSELNGHGVWVSSGSYSAVDRRPWQPFWKFMEWVCV